MGVLVTVYDAAIPTDTLTLREVTGSDMNVDYDQAKQEAKGLVRVVWLGVV
jgi:hypothetical protein